MAIDSECNVLHGAGRGIGGSITSVGLAKGRRNGLHIRIADKGDRALIVQSQKAVPGVFNAMHPLQRDQFHTEFVGKKCDLSFHIGGANGEVMESVNFVHRDVPLGYWLEIRNRA